MILTKIKDKILDRYDEAIKKLKPISKIKYSFSGIKSSSILEKLFSFIRSAIPFFLSPITAWGLKELVFKVFRKPSKPDTTGEYVPEEMEIPSEEPSVEPTEDTTAGDKVEVPAEPEEEPEGKPEESPAVPKEIPQKPKDSSKADSMRFFESIIGRTVVTSTYGYRKSTKSFHRGVDLRAKVGTPVKAPFDGYVLQLRNNLDDRGGRNIFLKSKSGMVIAAMHLSRIVVKAGQVVKKGQIVAYTGRSGYKNENAYAPHLHLQVGRSVNGKITWEDPQKFNYSEFLAKSVSGRRGSFNEDVKKAMELFIKDLHLTDFQAAGIVGNLIGESQLNPLAFNPKGGGRGAQGIAQWRGPRVVKFKELYGVEPKDCSDLLKQLNYVVYEFSTSYKSVLKALQSTALVSDAVDVVLRRYESPESPETYLEVRIKYANDALHIYAKKDIFISNKAYKFSSSSYTSNIRKQ